jgi:hypothetical protein
MTVQQSTIGQISRAFIALNGPRHGSCRGPLSKSKPENGTMGTELLIVGISLSFYALCALFVRICDRI